MEVELVRASEPDEPALQNLMQLYTHDFSAFWSGTARGDLGDGGRFGDYPLEPYWNRPNWRAFLLKTGGVLAGFAMVNDETHSGEAADHNMAEFFIARKYRRTGLGGLAARSLFVENPGVWEMAVARANTGALAFWRRAAAACPGALEISELDLRTEHWNGPIIRFRSSGGD